MGHAFVNDKLTIDNNRAVWTVKAVHKIHEKIRQLMELYIFYLSSSAYVSYDHSHSLEVYMI